MRLIFAATACALAASPALGCPQPDAERHAITSLPPYDAKPEEVVLKVSVPPRIDGGNPAGWQTIQVNVEEVFQGQYGGRTIILESGWASPTLRAFSSCDRLGPSDGYVSGKLKVDEHGYGTLYTRQRTSPRFDEQYALRWPNLIPKEDSLEKSQAKRRAWDLKVKALARGERRY